MRPRLSEEDAAQRKRWLNMPVICKPCPSEHIFCEMTISEVYQHRDNEVRAVCCRCHTDVGAPAIEIPMRPPDSEERCSLAHEVFDCVFEETESFQEDHIGSQLAYLLGAITDYELPRDSFVDWSPSCDNTKAIYHLFKDKFPPWHPVWEFINVIEYSPKKKKGD